MSNQQLPNAKFKTLEEFKEWYYKKCSHIQYDLKCTKGWWIGTNYSWSYIWKGEHVNGYKFAHNTKGPAEINENGFLFWYINGIRIPELEGLWYEELNEGQRNYLKLLQLKYGG